MDTILQSPSKTRTPGKIAGVRRYAAASGRHIQTVDGVPSPNRLERLAGFWHPLGVIVECGGGYQEIPTDLFAGLPTVYLDRNPRTLPTTASCVSHDSVATRHRNGAAAHSFELQRPMSDWNWQQRRHGMRPCSNSVGHSTEVFRIVFCRSMPLSLYWIFDILRA